ncbi:FG-GAP repeat protein [Hymenobacter sp. BRD67]|uniref:FG-GAP repeat protein n=1 Tax=Hymenobacter sp. BRD67 TaxID=2675877 RepID=UPI001564E680|nr:FG-GAP repeat protein [Hymenobacter sp. BRD67]QKG54246.1 hypothetical protein GKZ67_18655 [Hymenobacter sp. BRD67]
MGAEVGASQTGPGKAYIYEYTGGNWVLRQTLTAPVPKPGDTFGAQVFIDENTALVADINFLLPGAPGTSRGAVYVFTRQGSTWVQTGFILNPSIDIYGFGAALAKSGTDVVVGYPAGNILPFAVHVFRQPTQPMLPWTLVATLTPSTRPLGWAYGFSVAIEGDNLLVGAPDFDSNGQPAAYFYHRSPAGVWTLSQMEVYPEASDAGFRVGIHGNYAIVSSDNNLGVRFYELTASKWALRQTLFNPDSQTGQFGFSVALNGSVLLVGALLESYLVNGVRIDAGGSVYRYERRNGLWELRRRYRAPGPATGDLFGSWVAVDQRSNNFIVSAPGRSSQGVAIAGQAFVQWSPAILPAGPFCADAPAVLLQATAAGGMWSGPGITDALTGRFDPAQVGPGTYAVAYTLAAGGCTFRDTAVIMVQPALHVTRPRLPALSCAHDTIVTLSANVAGGLWSGSGISNGSAGSFSTAAAGPGRHVLTYSLAGAAACSGQDTLSLVVHPTVAHILSPTLYLCRLDTVFQLAASPSGGSWHGAGILNASLGNFSAAAAGAGRHVLRYELGNGACQVADSVIVNITSLPAPVLTPTGPLLLSCGQLQATLNVAAATPATVRYEWQYAPNGTTPGKPLPRPTTRRFIRRRRRGSTGCGPPNGIA